MKWVKLVNYFVETNINFAGKFDNLSFDVNMTRESNEILVLVRGSMLLNTFSINFSRAKDEASFRFIPPGYPECRQYHLFIRRTFCLVSFQLTKTSLRAGAEAINHFAAMLHILPKGF